MIGDTIRAMLLALPGVASSVADRVYANVRPPGIAVPAIVYTQISGLREMVQSGYADLTMSRYQLNVYAATYAQAEMLTRATIVPLDGYRGVVNGRRVGAVFVENLGDVPTLVASPASLTEFCKRFDLVVWHD